MANIASASAMRPDAEKSEPVAAPGVFAVPELLENILIFANTFDLYVYQSINSTFQGVISDSTAIRKIMLLDEANSEKEMEGFLNSRRSARAFYPFNIFDRHFTFIPSYPWMRNNQHFEVDDLPCSKPASWRHITVSPWEYGFGLVLENVYSHLGEEYLEVEYESTLGELVDRVISMFWNQCQNYVRWADLQEGLNESGGEEMEEEDSDIESMNGAESEE